MGRAYWVEGGEVWVADRATGRVVWHGRPEGHAALAALPVPGSCDGISLLDWMQEPMGTFRNVVRCRPDGSVVWRAQIPRRSHDFYTDARFEGGRLLAYSWSGHSCEIDPATGRILAATFIK